MNIAKLFTITLISVILVDYAHADEAAGGLLVGGSAETSSLSRDDNLVDDTSFGYKLFMQYRFTSWFGVEGAYFNSGELKSDATSAGGSLVDIVYDGFTLHAVGFIPLPVERLQWYLKGGFYKFDVDLTIDGSNSGRGSDTSAALGTGVSLGLTDRIHARTEFDWYDTSGADFWTLGLGLEYHF